MIVDDNVFNIMCLKNMLKQKCIESDSATDGQKAIDLVLKRSQSDDLP